MTEKAGLYFHIPFCRSKCPYCSFYSVKYDSAQAERYVKALIDEMQKYNGSFDTIYFGGGTPSMLEPELIGRIIDAAANHFDIDNNVEITVECNPSKDLKRDFELYRSYGVNRLSIGMQSAKNEERFALGRAAGQNEVQRTVEYARQAGINNISLDVMLATPKQTLDSLDETFEFIDKMNVTHISAYMLKIEQGTKFFEFKDRLALPDEDTACDMYLKTVESLDRIGFEQYEISNFCKKGYESRHNTKYWTLTQYLGIGASAHSYLNGKRFYYDNDFKLVQDGVGGTDEERVMLGLRLKKGVEKELIKNDYSKLLKLGYIDENNGRISLTPKGMLISNYIISELL